MTAAVKPFAVQPGEGRSLATPTGSSVTIKVDSGTSAGTLTVLEFVTEPKDGPPLHVHRNDDELWWVLEGEYRFRAGDAEFDLPQGGMAFGPRGTPHCFRNLGDTTGRLLVITTPAGLERYFEGFAGLLPGPVDPDAFAEVGRANGIEIVGPPLALPDRS
ncbi:cupin domain-containing protein [Pseudonocardia kujensis]|uniref:cupin domain-containing protein n=1 Tax=Pseudonocardia kujensis TaxID=1128675 RepID=UPI001E2BFDB2|nr:cupin domain-containing protein [Pseudonocardia kujensis]MCE0766259.1 cupin domain-containing protein [Pseudonocardia kujensis]